MNLMRHNINTVCEKFTLQLKAGLQKKNTLNSSQNYRRYRPTALILLFVNFL